MEFMFQERKKINNLKDSCDNFKYLSVLLLKGSHVIDSDGGMGIIKQHLIGW